MKNLQIFHLAEFTFAIGFAQIKAKGSLMPDEFAIHPDRVSEFYLNSDALIWN